MINEQRMVPVEPVATLSYDAFKDWFRVTGADVAALKLHTKNGSVAVYLAPPAPVPAVPDVVTDEMVEAFIEFADKTADIYHPEVPYMGTVNGDSAEAWRLRVVKAALNRALSAAPTYAPAEDGKVLPEQLRSRPDPEWYRRKILGLGNNEPTCIGPASKGDEE